MKPKRSGGYLPGGVAWRETKCGRRRVLEVGPFSKGRSERREEPAPRPPGRAAPGLKEELEALWLEENERGGEMGK